MSSSTPLDPAAGARNLLQNCIGVKTGECLLIVGENAELEYYDNIVCEIVAEQARALGVETSVLLTATAKGPEDIPSAVVEAMRNTDHTLFMSRLGDQIRFSKTHGCCTKTMCYTLDADYLGSEFARVPHGLSRQVHDQLLDSLLAARHYRITCPMGTDLTGDVGQDGTSPTRRVLTEFSVNPFPVLIYPPLDCVNLNGKLALSRFLLSTSINTFDGSSLIFDQSLMARIENSRIIAFEGDRQLVARIDAHYQKVAAFFGGDPYAMNSWHAGIYPKTYYTGEPLDNVQRWSDLAFGSPRYTHFHTCGNSPGNVSCSIFDADISFDGEPIWQAGRLAFLDRPECQALLDDFHGCADAFEMRGDIGI